MTIKFQQQWIDGSGEGSFPLADLDLFSEGGSHYLLAAGLNGDIHSLKIGADGRLAQVAGRDVGTDMIARTGVAGTILSGGDGPRYLVAGGSAGLVTLDIAAGGALAAPEAVGSPGLAGTDFTVAEQLSGGAVVARSADGRGLTLTAEGVPRTILAEVDDGADFHSLGIADLAVLRMGGADVIVAAAQGTGWGQADAGVTTWISSGTDLRTVDSFGAFDGVGFMVPTAVEIVSAGGQTWVVLASAQGASGGLSVMALSSQGDLLPVDHVNDTRDTRFGGAQALAATTVGDRAYVVAGGTDGGVSLFLVMPDGMLVLLASFEDTLKAGLADVTALALHESGGLLHIYATSEQEAGVAHLTYDPDDAGLTLRAGASGERLSGTNGVDLISGGRGDDTLDGGGRGDIISDGAGADRMTGSWGHDTYVLAADGAIDVITDFHPDQDRLDLGAWPFLYDPGSLTVVSTSTGARIDWYGETLILHSVSGDPMTAEQVRAAVVRGTNRTFRLPDMTLEGGAGSDTLSGSWGSDELHGGGGDDLLDGGDGDDRIRGDGGDDTLVIGDDLAATYVRQTGEDGFRLESRAGVDLASGIEHFQFTDTTISAEDLRVLASTPRALRLDGTRISERIFGRDGDDSIIGRDGADTLEGNGGADMIKGGAGNDVLIGGDGHDRLLSGAGDDTLLGQAGSDTLSGSFGADRIAGGAGADRMLGGNGADTIGGGNGADKVFGGEGDDDVDGGRGSDFLRGQGGDDTLAGGGGADTLDGGAGRDRIEGGAGADRMDGGAGRDTLLGNGADDVLNGRGGSDILNGGADDDRLLGANGHDMLIGGLGRDDLRGGFGDDDLSGGAGRDVLAGAVGDDTLRGHGGHDTLDGGGGADRLLGGSMDDVLGGGAGRDALFGGSGADRLNGGAWRDQLTGGGGADVFVFRKGTGRDDVTDFDRGRDRLLLDDAMLGSADTGAKVVAHYAEVTSKGVVFDLPGDDQILLIGLDRLAGLAGSIDFM